MELHSSTPRKRLRWEGFRKAEQRDLLRAEPEAEQWGRVRPGERVRWAGLRPPTDPWGSLEQGPWLPPQDELGALGMGIRLTSPAPGPTPATCHLYSDL